jgi:hypothetical protein
LRHADDGVEDENGKNLARLTLASAWWVAWVLARRDTYNCRVYKGCPALAVFEKGKHE